MTLKELHEYTTELLANRPELADLEVRTIADRNDDDRTETAGVPTEGHMDTDYCIMWLGEGEEQGEYEAIVGDKAPANVILM